MSGVAHVDRASLARLGSLMLHLGHVGLERSLRQEIGGSLLLIEFIGSGSVLVVELDVLTGYLEQILVSWLRVALV